MNQQEIERLAEESGLSIMPGWVHQGRGAKNLAKFAELVRRHALEEAAITAENMGPACEEVYGFGSECISTADDIALAIRALAQKEGEAPEDDRIDLGVIELHPKAALRDDFYRVVDDLRRAGCIVDVWLMDIQTVLKRHGYRMEVYRALITGKDKG